MLKEYVNQFKPHHGWSGSLAAILEANAALLDALDSFPELVAAIAREKERFRATIKQERHWELERGRERDERFE